MVITLFIFFGIIGGILISGNKCGNMDIKNWKKSLFLFIIFVVIGMLLSKNF